MPPVGPKGAAVETRDYGARQGPTWGARRADMTTMLGPLRRARRIASGRTAVSSADVELCYADTWDRCRRPVGGLRGLELGEGDRVAVVGPNCHRNLELYQAVAGAGMVLVPLNRRHTEAELRYVHDHAGVAVLFAGRDVGSARESVKHVTIWARSASGCSPAAPRPTCATTCRRTRSPASSTLAARRAPQRGVTLTHRNLVANVFNYQAFAPFRPQTCWLIAAPLFRHPAVPEAAV